MVDQSQPANVLIWPRWVITSIITPEKYEDYSAMRWPCDEWFHIPTSNEFSRLFNVGKNMWAWTNSWWNNLKTYLKLPYNWCREDRWWVYWAWEIANYYTCSVSWADSIRFFFRISDWAITPAATINREYWLWIRPFKDVSVVPDENWTELYPDPGATWWTLWPSWIYHNATLWLISISNDWNNWITIADKNLWATSVYNDWATLTQANCWNHYQRWNNYWFAFTWSVTTSATKVDASNYWPDNYYSSSTFITWWWDRSTVKNDNLWWWQTWIVQKHVQTNWVAICYKHEEQPTWYQEVEYIESWSDWNEQFIRMMFTYDNWAIYTYEIDVSNVWSATWKLFSYMQSVGGEMLRIYKEVCNIDQDMYTAAWWTFTPDTYSIDWRYLYEWWFVNNEVDFRFDLLSDANFRLYSFKAYKDWDLYRDMIPCYDRATWEIWMYDTLNDEFYTNQWTWSFVKGPDV
jgi:hypothetical protein